MKGKDIRFLHSIQALRGIAVVMVVFYHVYIIGGDGNYLGYAVLEMFSEPGKFGVNLFFVLSGFIIFHAHSSDMGQPKRIAGYLYKRFSRIFPVYWVFLTFYVLAAYFGVGHADFSWDVANLISAFLLWGGYSDLTLPLKVAWTLCYELIFYALFILFLFSIKLGVILSAVWAGTLIFANVFFDDAIGVRGLEVWNINFILGGVCFYIYNKVDRFDIKFIFIMLALAVVGFAFSALMTNFSKNPLADENKYTQIILSLSLFLFVLASLFANDFFKSAYLSWMIKIGDASYSIYLTHSACISLIYIILRKFNLLSSDYSVGVFIYFIASIMSIAVGYLAFLIIEKPLVKIFRSFYTGKTKRNNSDFI
jgi:peptidoglycan/LPS O-acetylase OafA/YrhL